MEPPIEAVGYIITPSPFSVDDVPLPQPTVLPANEGMSKLQHLIVDCDYAVMFNKRLYAPYLNIDNPKIIDIYQLILDDSVLATDGLCETHVSLQSLLFSNDMPSLPTKFASHIDECANTVAALGLFMHRPCVRYKLHLPTGDTEFRDIQLFVEEEHGLVAQAVNVNADIIKPEVIRLPNRKCTCSCGKTFTNSSGLRGHVRIVGCPEKI